MSKLGVTRTRFLRPSISNCRSMATEKMKNQLKIKSAKELRRPQNNSQQVKML